MDMEQEKKCAHPPCSCTARLKDDYCSDECRDEDQAEHDSSYGEGAEGCHCGHAGCTGETVSTEQAESLRLATEAIAGV